MTDDTTASPTPSPTQAPTPEPEADPAGTEYEHKAVETGVEMSHLVAEGAGTLAEVATAVATPLVTGATVPTDDPGSVAAYGSYVAQCVTHTWAGAHHDDQGSAETEEQEHVSHMHLDEEDFSCETHILRWTPDGPVQVR
jgi:hypothetical protein